MLVMLLLWYFYYITFLNKYFCLNVLIMNRLFLHLEFHSSLYVGLLMVVNLHDNFHLLLLINNLIRLVHVLCTIIIPLEHYNPSNFYSLFKDLSYYHNIQMLNDVYKMNWNFKNFLFEYNSMMYKGLDEGFLFVFQLKH